MIVLPQFLYVHTFLVEVGVSTTAGEADLPLRGLSASFFAILVGTGATIAYNFKQVQWLSSGVYANYSTCHKCYGGDHNSKETIGQYHIT